MNRLQKKAWAGLICCILIITCWIISMTGMYAVPVPGFREMPLLGFEDINRPGQIEIVFRRIMCSLLFVLPVVALTLLLVPKKKQTPAEPDFDELDTAIHNQAIRTSFFFVWFLWPLMLILIMSKIGFTGMLPTIAFFHIHLIVFLLCMTIYFLDKVILYWKNTRGGNDI